MSGSNVSNYIRNPNSSFFSLEDDDMDDEEFLRKSRPSYTSYSQNSGRSTNPFYNDNSDLDRRRQELLEKKKEIEERSLASTERSLGLLRESEQVGIATAEELRRQREQLERTERSLDNINTTLRFTQKNIDGIKSVFGSLKNYLTKKGDPPPGLGASGSKDSSVENDITSKLDGVKNLSSPSDHPGLRIRGLAEEESAQSSRYHSSNNHEKRLEQNLDVMSSQITNLKGLAQNLGEEIISQNDLVDNIIYKTEGTDFKLSKQNKEMNTILKKK